MEVETRLFLVGDGGAPSANGEPVLQALSRELSQDPVHSLVVFLGDNLYPRGLVEPAAPERAEGERRLAAQIDTVSSAGVRAIFVPGNHDWAHEAADGWAAIKRQNAFVEGRAACFLPRGGCPGPALVDVGERLRLVLLDTQWWLHPGPKPRGGECPAGSEAEVLAALREALRTAGARQVAVLAHHPLATGGPHGGHFGWKDHIFPLRAMKRWLWLPLPGIGSIYPLARRSGISPQDVSSGVNQKMRAALEGVLREHPPLVWGSGHDHNLQVLRGDSARHLLVSGVGIFGHTTRTVCTAESRYARRGAGFMRLDVTSAGRVRLAVLEVAADGSTLERFGDWLN